MNERTLILSRRMLLLVLVAGVTLMAYAQTAGPLATDLRTLSLISGR